MSLGIGVSRAVHTPPIEGKLDSILSCCNLIGHNVQQTCVQMLATPSQSKLENPLLKVYVYIMCIYEPHPPQ